MGPVPKLYQDMRGSYCVLYRDTLLGIGYKNLKKLEKKINRTRHEPFMSRILFPRQPLWSSGHGSWLQIQRSGFDSRPTKFFSEK
jgi:hypothetical protein